jgi:hypothetical protein
MVLTIMMIAFDSIEATGTIRRTIRDNPSCERYPLLEAALPSISDKKLLSGLLADLGFSIPMISGVCLIKQTDFFSSRSSLDLASDESRLVRTNPVNRARVDRLRETRPSAGVSVAFFAIPIGVWQRFG